MSLPNLPSQLEQVRDLNAGRQVRENHPQKVPPFGDDRDGLVGELLAKGDFDARLRDAGFDVPRYTLAGDLLMATSDDVPAIWGSGKEVLWPEGEPLMIAGATSIGKTTLAQNVVLAALGVAARTVLGFPVSSKSRVVYLAADRPAQALRSMRRLVDEGDRHALNSGLIMHRGPLPFRLEDDPQSLLRFVDAVGGDSVVIDSLKDVTGSLTSDEAGQAYNRAVQSCVAAGVDVLTLHHNRKANDGRSTRTVDEVYGSTFLTAGQGSVLALEGRPGDTLLKLRSLKSPSGDVGPIGLRLDLDSGRVSRTDGTGLIPWVLSQPGGCSARDAAEFIEGNGAPDRAAIERARRQLDGLVKSGQLVSTDFGRTKRYRGPP
jgi:replicative DNA helicase